MSGECECENYFDGNDLYIKGVIFTGDICVTGEIFSAHVNQDESDGLIARIKALEKIVNEQKEMIKDLYNLVIQSRK